ncbi:hypothetical protein AVEN_196997-1 [Araneus ventricosus]|uniref:Uncharacterized protein n=1 Tax=Araneus ventricosus TaxID=182803 RepID=A0A4Y2EEA7_ARAVE|nr:hypothetical protein AVEN_196997-1 [Araneus ventricosus]
MLNWLPSSIYVINVVKDCVIFSEGLKPFPYLTLFCRDTSVTFLPQFTYPPPAYYGYPGPQYMTANPGQTALVYHPERYRPDGTDMAMGMLGGAAVGSLMWGPLLWW